MQKGKTIENIVFLIKQYEKELNSKDSDYTYNEREMIETFIIELKFMLDMAGVKYE